MKTGCPNIEISCRELKYPTYVTYNPWNSAAVVQGRAISISSALYVCGTGNCRRRQLRQPSRLRERGVMDADGERDTQADRAKYKYTYR
jgi:hypothetical protein